MRWSLVLVLLVLAASEIPLVASGGVGCPYVVDPFNGNTYGCRNSACPDANDDPLLLAGCLLPPPPEPGEAPAHYAQRVVQYYVCMDLSDSPPDVAISPECGPSTIDVMV